MFQVLVNRLGLSLPGKLVMLNDCLDMAVVVDWDVKTTKQLNQTCRRVFEGTNASFHGL